MEFQFKSMVKNTIPLDMLDYKIIEEVREYENSMKCIIIKNMHPDFTLLLGSISLIISEKGSPLSHLAIMAREYGIPVVLIPGITSEIPKQGSLSINEEVVKFEK